MTKKEFIKIRRKARKAGANAPVKDDIREFEKHKERNRRNLWRRPDTSMLGLTKISNWKVLPIHNEDPQVRKIENQRRIKNWRLPKATQRRESHGNIISVNCGRYSSRCRYVKSEYYIVFRACYILIPKIKKLIVRYALNQYVLSAPRGWEWAEDENGLCIRKISQHGCNYHPFAHEFAESSPRDFAKIARDNYATMCKSRKIEKLYAAIPDDQVLVSIRDARKAGNCLPGILNFMQAHKIKSKAVPANILRRMETNSPKRVQATIATAKKRLAESLVNGYSPLYPIA